MITFIRSFSVPCYKQDIIRVKNCSWLQDWPEGFRQQNDVLGEASVPLVYTVCKFCFLNHSIMLPFSTSLTLSISSKIGINLYRLTSTVHNLVPRVLLLAKKYPGMGQSQACQNLAGKINKAEGRGGKVDNCHNDKLYMCKGEKNVSLETLCVCNMSNECDTKKSLLGDS